MTTLTSRETNDFDRFDRIYKEYAARMVVFARRFVSDEFAEDIVQDVFVRIWQQERFLMPTSELRSYLYRSVLNGCRNAIRHEMVADRFARNSLAELRLGEVEYELRVLDEPRDERTERLHRGAAGPLPRGLSPLVVRRTAERRNRRAPRHLAPHGRRPALQGAPVSARTDARAAPFGPRPLPFLHVSMNFLLPA